VEVKDNKSVAEPDITAIIINYKTPKLTNQAIASVLNNSQGIAKEIIVVDNSSNDGSCGEIKSRWGDNIKLIENKTNVGFAKANNQAMRIGEGRYYLLLNSDAEIAGDAIEKMVGFAESNTKVSILGCKIVSNTGQQQVSCWCTYSLSFLFSRAFNLYRFLPNGTFGSINIETYGKPQNSRSVDVVSGCTMLVRRTAAEKVGLFDEQFFMYCEDMDWCTRMRKAGFDVYFLADATVKHYGGGTNPNKQYRTLVQQGESVLMFMRKEYGGFSALLANVLLALFFVIRLPYWFFASIFGKNKVYSREVNKAYIYAFWWHILWPFCHNN
jgi:GT2 family glycosyltransferase